MADLEFHETISDRLQIEGYYAALVRPSVLRSLAYCGFFFVIWVAAVLSDTATEWLPLALIPPIGFMMGILTVVFEAWSGRVVIVAENGRASASVKHRVSTSGQVVATEVVHDRRGNEILILKIESTTKRSTKMSKVAVRCGGKKRRRLMSRLK